MYTTLSSEAQPRSRLSMPAALLRLEGLVVLAVSLALYAYQGFNWWVFALLLLAPDVTIAVYAVNKRAGSVAYNIAHTYALPLALAVLALYAGWLPGLQIALIWTAHIGMDRAVGYGLKYPGDFKDTHLSRV